MRAGVAIGVGKVMYGNIGTADRLDFTVIGPVVNLVSRLEALSLDPGNEKAIERLGGARPRASAVDKLKNLLGRKDR